MSKEKISDFNLTRINTKEAEEITKSVIAQGSNLFLAALRGTGKTMILKQVIKEMGCKEIYINASVIERTDAAGLPRIMDVKDNDFIRYLLPEYYRSLMTGDQKCVVLFDEIDKAASEITSTLLEFTQFHTVNGKYMPNLQACLMTGNLISEGSQRPALPLLDRAEKYMMESSPNQWLDWGSKSGTIHPSVSAFIADNKECLQCSEDADENYASESPRGWENASKIVRFGEKNRHNPKLIALQVAGAIGKRSGIKYASYFEHYQVLVPLIEKVLQGKDVRAEYDKLNQGQKMVACMIICSKLATAIDELEDKGDDKVRLSDEKEENKVSLEKKRKLLPGMAQTVAKFISPKVVDPEMSLIAVRSQIGIDRFISSGLDEMQEWSDILDDISKRINGGT